MMLKQLTHYPGTNSVEATWTNADDVQTRCHSYADVQMQMLRDDIAEYGGEVTDYEELIATVEAGIVPYIPPPPVIADISPRQIRMALTRAGLRANVEAAVTAGDQDLKDWYEFSTAFERSNPLVDAMGAALGVSSEALDALWQLGASL